MKRHPAFAQLSRDHHRTLLIAQSIKKGAPQYRGMATTQEGKRNEVILHYKEQLVDHFWKEEKVLAACRSLSPQVDELIKEIFEEHIKVREMIQDLEGRHDEELTTALNNLGILLEKHIRKEERQLFELLQEKLSEEQLNHIAKELSDQ